jgi:hypothetical protein
LRSIAQYLSDDPANPLPYTVAALQSSTALANILMDSSGKFESAVMRSSFYKLEDLQNLSGVSLSNVKKYICDIAMMSIINRRPGHDPPATAVQSYNEAQEFLKALSQGEAILSFAETQSAGLPEVLHLSEVDFVEDNLVSTIWTRAFGQRQKDRRP